MHSLRVREIRAVYNTRQFSGSEPLSRIIREPKDAVQLFKDLADETKEHFVCLHLNQQNKLLCFDTVSIGSLTASIVHPREVFKSALLSSAASLVCIHNHPSGDPAPSLEDREITRRLCAAGELLGVTVRDHIVIGQGRFISFLAEGFMDTIKREAAA